MKRGYFGGSFDPIHNGHIHLALELFEKHNLDEVLFCPTSQSPHKKHAPPLASKEHRRAMVTAAISPFPQFTFLDYVLQKSEPCYTIDTIRTLTEENRKIKYFLLLGEDSVHNFSTWKEVDELVKLATPLVGSREKDLLPEEIENLSPELMKLLKKGWTPIPRLEISSTWIRSRVQKGEYAGHLVPGKVWEYIQTHQLYTKQK